jgi:uncharacterized membrane protein YjjB (DUF3815 family)
VIRSLTDFVAAEKAKLWHSLGRSAVLLALAIFATLAAFGGLVFALLGIYLSLETVMAPWLAGVIVGCTMILIAVIALWIIMRLFTKQGRPETLPSASTSTLAAAHQPSGTVPEALRATVGDVLGASNIKASDIVIAALIAGLVLGASGRLRERLFRSITRS